MAECKHLVMKTPENSQVQESHYFAPRGEPISNDILCMVTNRKKNTDIEMKRLTISSIMNKAIKICIPIGNEIMLNKLKSRFIILKWTTK